MAAGADDVVQRMSGTADVGAAQSLGVAAQTVVENRFGLGLGEGHDSGFAAARFHMGFARAVTAFASGPVGRFLTGCDTLLVLGLLKPAPNARSPRLPYIPPSLTRPAHPFR